MTLCIVLVGAVIFCAWVVIPVGEFREIYAQLRAKGAIRSRKQAKSNSVADAADREGGR